LPVQRCVEFALLVAGLFAIGISVFGLEAAVAGNYPALLYVPLPLLLWAAVRFGPSGLVPSLLIIAVLCLLNAFAGRGPFAAQSPAENVLSLQIFLIAMFVPLMLLAALIEERRDNENALRESEERLARTEKFSPLDDDFAIVAFQAVRELLINVVKHSGVKEAIVYVTRKAGAVIINVEDQGKGFLPDTLDLPDSQGGGFGLFSIRERLSLSGGDLAIKSSPGNGTSAQVVIPVAATETVGAFPDLAS
jgi:anti-sigma regulatory factor (Ser/Thr protein kinase)